eukprot:Gregarina_sp_Poly_1__7794@NODE_440_length_8372_cov_344_424925_g359_i0_p1_GENE_NODE_440_length_8372_cov_344_424925_g359_i0NODE_440_length_8372_cov_344_424925_g359_i0_p1_ORF_typecomplete_len1270_score203_77zfMIZ/PF02891_20/4_9e03zfMIZ/PF02891_20/2_4e03zfMIZ/PF02891_20/7_2e16Chromo/PF00385_24/4_6Chromo/PF00385_24/4e08Chromo/PF00385_24/5e03zfNse/PF11789_8/0_38MRNIP/PF15749_5/3_1e02MRNIP/PF15749_5/2_1e02_NODE_440_length_8372_cov_344_424925_g359_i042018010
MTATAQWNNGRQASQRGIELIKIIGRRFRKNRSVELRCVWAGPFGDWELWEPLNSLPRQVLPRLISNKSVEELPEIEDEQSYLSEDETTIPEDGVLRVERVLCYTEKNGGGRILIKWRNLPMKDSTWEPIENVLDEIGLIEEIEKAQENWSRVTGKTPSTQLLYDAVPPIFRKKRPREVMQSPPSTIQEERPAKKTKQSEPPKPVEPPVSPRLVTSPPIVAAPPVVAAVAAPRAPALPPRSAAEAGTEGPLRSAGNRFGPSFIPGASLSKRPQQAPSGARPEVLRERQKMPGGAPSRTSEPRTVAVKDNVRIVRDENDLASLKSRTRPVPKRKVVVPSHSSAHRQVTRAESPDSTLPTRKVIEERQSTQDDTIAKINRLLDEQDALLGVESAFRATAANNSQLPAKGDYRPGAPVKPRQSEAANRFMQLERRPSPKGRWMEPTDRPHQTPSILSRNETSTVPNSVMTRTQSSLQAAPDSTVSSREQSGTATDSSISWKKSVMESGPDITSKKTINRPEVNATTKKTSNIEPMAKKPMSRPEPEAISKKTPSRPDVEATASKKSMNRLEFDTMSKRPINRLDRDPMSKKGDNRPETEALPRRAFSRQEPEVASKKNVTWPEGETTASRRPPSRPETESQRMELEWALEAEALAKKGFKRLETDALSKKSVNRPEAESLSRKPLNRPEMETVTQKPTSRFESEGVLRKPGNRPEADFSRKMVGPQKSTTQPPPHERETNATVNVMECEVTSNPQIIYPKADPSLKNSSKASEPSPVGSKTGNKLVNGTPRTCVDTYSNKQKDQRLTSTGLRSVSEQNPIKRKLTAAAPFIIPPSGLWKAFRDKCVQYGANFARSAAAPNAGKCYCAPGYKEPHVYFVDCFRRFNGRLIEEGIRCTICKLSIHFYCAIKFLEWEFSDNVHKTGCRQVMDWVTADFIEKFASTFQCAICRLAQSDPFFEIENILDMKVLAPTHPQTFNKTEANAKSGAQDVTVQVRLHQSDIPLLKAGARVLQLRAFKMRSDMSCYPKFPNEDVEIVYNKGAAEEVEKLHKPPAFRVRKDTNKLLPKGYIDNVGQSQTIRIHAQFENAYDGPYFVATVRSHPETPVDKIVKRIIENSTASVEHCIQFAVHFLQPADPPEQGDDDDEDLMVVDSLNPLSTVKLTCPSTMCRIGIPARGYNCKHVQCFDLEFFVQSQRNAIHQARWKCSVCRKNCRPHELLVDAWQQQILAKTTEEDKQIILAIDENSGGNLTWELHTEHRQQQNATTAGASVCL